MTPNEFQQEFRLLLQTDIVTFHYRKKNGKLRKATGTTCLDFVPTDLLPKGIGAQRPEGYVNYYDLTVCGWRTLRLKYVTSYQIPTPEPCPPSQIGICSPLWGRSHAGGCSKALRREWGIRSPLWGRSHTDGCSKDPSRPSRPRGVESEHPATQADEGNHRSPQGALS